MKFDAYTMSFQCLPLSLFQAINFYSRANNIKSGDPIILSNRSAAYIRLIIVSQFSFELLVINVFIIFK